jgi:hypothetical protein
MNTIEITGMAIVMIVLSSFVLGLIAGIMLAHFKMYHMAPKPQAPVPVPDSILMEQRQSENRLIQVFKSFQEAFEKVNGVKPDKTVKG